ncbi:hypothetical protein C8J57DRAFT_1345262 [Mycena rebaudengoi]|nr:hypothetical protein C8J57DRAFT_1345262 [Mycena rebaudengoi]
MPALAGAARARWLRARFLRFFYCHLFLARVSGMGWLRFASCWPGSWAARLARAAVAGWAAGGAGRWRASVLPSLPLTSSFGDFAFGGPSFIKAHPSFLITATTQFLFFSGGQPLIKPVLLGLVATERPPVGKIAIAPLGGWPSAESSFWRSGSVSFVKIGFDAALAH